MLLSGLSTVLSKISIRSTASLKITDFFRPNENSELVPFGLGDFSLELIEILSFTAADALFPYSSKRILSLACSISINDCPTSSACG